MKTTITYFSSLGRVVHQTTGLVDGRRAGYGIKAHERHLCAKGSGQLSKLFFVRWLGDPLLMGGQWDQLRRPRWARSLGSLGIRRQRHAVLDPSGSLCCLGLLHHGPVLLASHLALLDKGLIDSLVARTIGLLRDNQTLTSLRRSSSTVPT